jgi:hypothetical protein
LRESFPVTLQHLETSRTDSHFNRTGLSVEEQIGRVKRPLAVATGCAARWSSHFWAGADAKVAARDRPFHTQSGVRETAGHE